MNLLAHLKLLLRTYGVALSAMHDTIGPEATTECLERIGEDENLSSDRWNWTAYFNASNAPHAAPPVNPYQELEGVVRDLHIPATSNLVFYIWSLAPYRALIESNLDLEAMLNEPVSETQAKLADAFLDFGKAWVAAFPVAEPFKNRLENKCLAPWIRARSELLKGSRIRLVQ